MLPWTRIKYVLTRTVITAAIIFMLATAAFFAVRLAPGDPARNVAGISATPDEVEAQRHALGLDRPVQQQYVDYIKGMARFDFGNSYRTGDPVATTVAAKVLRTATLAVGAAMTILITGLGSGVAMAALTWRGGRRRIEAVYSGVTGVIGAVPDYVSGALLIIVFALWLDVLPAGGSTGAKALVLPLVALSLRPFSVLTRIARVETLAVLNQDYIRTARSKGIPPLNLYMVHVLPNVMAPTLTVVGLVLASLLGGVVVIEGLFARSGLGTTLVDALLANDYPMVQAIIVLFGVTVVVINLAVEMLVAVVDPRSATTSLAS
jgi:peptide/nickel transport system permease protein